MGPRLFRRGRKKVPSAISTAVRLQWGHAFSGVEGKPLLTTTRSSLSLQWGHAFSGVEGSLRGLYRVFPALLQWGHAFSGVEGRRRRYVEAGGQCASMGPRLLRRGRPTKTPFYEWQIWLQWGHAFSGVEGLDAATGKRFSIALQWGHAFSGVEGQQSERSPDLDPPASMGPRLLRRGRMPRKMAMPRRSPRFNGATPSQAWKD